MTQSSSNHHTMGSSLFPSRLITTINWSNSSKKRRKIKRFMKLVDVIDNKLLLFHSLISQWKTHQTFSIMKISKKKKMLLLQNNQRTEDRSILPKYSYKFKAGIFTIAKTLTLGLSIKFYSKKSPTTK